MSSGCATWEEHRCQVGVSCARTIGVMWEDYNCFCFLQRQHSYVNLSLPYALIRSHYAQSIDDKNVHCKVL